MISRLKRSIENRSLREIAGLIGKNVAHGIKALSPRALRIRADNLAFDRRWGIDTMGTCNLSALQIDPQLARHGVRYQASDGDLMLNILDRLPIVHSDFNFIDFGSGKGRIVLFASQRNFKKVYGVEISPELVSIAKRNLESFKEKNEKIAPIKMICSSAEKFEIPDGNIVCYFYNPFDKTIMRPVVENLENHFSRGGATIYVIYVDPRHRAIFDQSGCWRAETFEDVLVFSSIRGSPSA